MACVTDDHCPGEVAARRTAALVRPAPVSAIKIVLARPRSVSRDAAWSVGRTDTVPVSRPASTTAARVAPRRSADTMAIAALGSVAWSGVALMIQAAADQTKTVPRISAVGAVAVSPSKAAASQTVTAAPIRRVRTGSASRAINQVSEATARRRLLRPEASGFAGVWDNQVFCSIPCGQSQDCPLASMCTTMVGSATSYCVPSARRTVVGARGQACQNPTMCRSGVCANTQQGAFVSAIALVTTTAATPSRAWRWL